MYVCTCVCIYDTYTIYICKYMYLNTYICVFVYEYI